MFCFLQVFLSFFSSVLLSLAIPNELFKSMFIKECLNLSKNISIYKIKRPKDKNSLAQVVSIIEKLSE